MNTNLWTYIFDNLDLIWARTLEHVELTLIALGIAAALGITLGLLISRYKKLAGPILTVVNIVQTIPSLALLGLFIPLFGIGTLTAIVALFLYALLPIVRNTYTGISEVDPAIIDASRGMGLTSNQILWRIELPLSLPTIFAGLKTAAVITVGVATLSALIAAGGLGDFIFRGISLNNSAMILTGALPAAVLALLFDGALSLLEKASHQLQKASGKRLGLAAAGLGLVVLMLIVIPFVLSPNQGRLTAGFTTEFAERKDGYLSLQTEYDLKFNVRTLEAGLMYAAVANGEVDLISAYATDGRIKAHNLHLLKDNKGAFPDYHAFPLVRQQSLDAHPEIRDALSALKGKLSDSLMTAINYEVDFKGRKPRKVARDYLQQMGFQLRKASGNPEIKVGAKNFTESYILAYMFEALIETKAGLPVAVLPGMGGTKICFSALQEGEIDLYPEYTGTAFMVLLDPSQEERKALIGHKSKMKQYLMKNINKRYKMTLLPYLGFNNAYALAVREEMAKTHQLETISDLHKVNKN